MFTRMVWQPRVYHPQKWKQSLNFKPSYLALRLVTTQGLGAHFQSLRGGYLRKHNVTSGSSEKGCALCRSLFVQNVGATSAGGHTIGNRQGWELQSYSCSQNAGRQEAPNWLWGCQVFDGVQQSNLLQIRCREIFSVVKRPRTYRQKISRKWVKELLLKYSQFC